MEIPSSSARSGARKQLLALLLRVSRTLGDLDSVPEMLSRILDLVLEIEGAERGYAMLLDESLMGLGDFGKGRLQLPARAPSLPENRQRGGAHG